MDEFAFENLFTHVPATSPQELFTTLLARPGIRIERILSFGQASPEGFWYEQETSEWVLLVQGTAGLLFEGQQSPTELKAGDFINIPALTKHRVAWTSSTPPVIWLAIHYAG